MNTYYIPNSVLGTGHIFSCPCATFGLPLQTPTQLQGGSPLPRGTWQLISRIRAFPAGPQWSPAACVLNVGLG